MAGGRGKINEHPNSNSNGFRENKKNIYRGGKSFSIKKAFNEIVSNENRIIWFNEKEGEQRINKGVKEVGFNIPFKYQIVIRLQKLALSANDRIAFNALKFLWEQFDGKAKSNTEVKYKYNLEGFDSSLLSQAQNEEFLSLLKIGLSDKIRKHED